MGAQGKERGRGDRKKGGREDTSGPPWSIGRYGSFSSRVPEWNTEFGKQGPTTPSYHIKMHEVSGWRGSTDRMPLALAITEQTELIAIILTL